jgi:hypothetical protein
VKKYFEKHINIRGEKKTNKLIKPIKQKKLTKKTKP